MKQVPAKDAPLAIVEGGAWIRESDIGFETNEPDGYALEEALRLKEKHGGEVVAISMGPERSKQTIKEALAKGADRGIHVADNEFHKLDPLNSARSLAAAIKNENFDLILTGLQSDDQGFGQTGVLLAELLGRPHATIIMAHRGDGRAHEAQARARSGMVPVGRAAASRRSFDSVRHQQAALRDTKGIMAAKKKEIATVDRASLGVPDSPTQRVERIYVPQKTKKTEFITGQPKEIAAKLIEKLKHEARVL